MFIGKFRLESPVMNASGMGTVTKAQIQELETTSIGAIVTKTATWKPRKGNPPPTFCWDEFGSVNCVGLKNLGFEYYRDIKSTKPIILSVVPDPKIFDHLSCDRRLIEVNISCPTFETGSLRRVAEASDFPFGVKVGPNTDPESLRGYNLDFVTCCNTMGYGTIRGITGGIGGKYLKPFSIATLRKMRSLNCVLIGCGGIESGRDIMEYKENGATGFQIGTQFFKEGPSVFERIDRELKASSKL